MGQKFKIILMIINLMTLNVLSNGTPPNDVYRSHDKVTRSLDNVAAEAGCSYLTASRDNKSSAPLDNGDMNDRLTPDKPRLSFELMNQSDQKVILETETRAVFTFQYLFECNNFSKTHQLIVTAPQTKTLDIEMDEKSKVYFDCDAAWENKSATVNNDASYESLNNSQRTMATNNQSARIYQGHINVTLIGGLIGVSHINFSVYSFDENRENDRIVDVLVFGAQKSNSSANSSENQQIQMFNKKENLTLLETASLEVLVVKLPKVIDTVFITLAFVMEIVQMVALGSLVELDDFKKTLKRPLPTIVGLLCHYVIMTLIAYTVAKLIKPDYPLDAAGTFTTGICPGGSTSNIYAYLLYGDLPLSLTITILSYVIAFAMMPIWMYTIGQEFFIGYNIAIPYMDLVIMLVIMLPSLITGMLIRKRFPDFIDQLQNILTPIIILVAIGFLSTGIYASMYVFYLLDLRLTIIGCALSYAGYTIGAVILLPFKRSRKTTITMSLEVGVKNTGIGYNFLLNSMPPPLGDIASVVTASVEVASQIPPFLVSLVLVIYEMCRKKYKPVNQEETHSDNEPM